MYGVLVIDLKMKNYKLLSSERFRDLLCFSFYFIGRKMFTVIAQNECSTFKLHKLSRHAISLHMHHDQKMIIKSFFLREQLKLLTK